MLLSQSKFETLIYNNIINIMHVFLLHQSNTYSGLGNKITQKTKLAAYDLPSIPIYKMEKWKKMIIK